MKINDTKTAQYFRSYHLMTNIQYDVSIIAKILLNNKTTV
jgi:hypothetical protein